MAYWCFRWMSIFVCWWVFFFVLTEYFFLLAFAIGFKFTGGPRRAADDPLVNLKPMAKVNKKNTQPRQKKILTNKRKYSSNRNTNMPMILSFSVNQHVLRYLSLILLVKNWKSLPTFENLKLNFKTKFSLKFRYPY